MLFGRTVYAEGFFSPEMGISEGQWYVWCATGALSVLQAIDLRRWFLADRTRKLQILFANNAAARIEPGHPLWDELVGIAKEHSVKVFPLDFSGKYVRWRGDSRSLQEFDAIIICPIGY